ncbi:homoserine dehydrogenase [uncultured Ferrovibrio sp.]|jgi:homoserine dehydrogenase|uniref:homoserine dehydrogenase n=1 Tax=uncultured Ferrovibrio sp. TaxID=1576913 RepID=UPI0026062F41|nr:homoserine dehydrogenase [uncultured Ferrovibrio sp.]
MVKGIKNIAPPLKVGIAGLGVVGAGVVRLLDQQADILAARAGRPIKVVAVSARDRRKKRDMPKGNWRWFEKAADLAKDPEVDVVVELIGGADGPARALVEAALSAGKGVVTANKAMLAMHGAKIAALAEANNAPLAFEAAVAGGIPIVKALREGLIGNRVEQITGILNGTCNYILTEMRTTGRDFGEVLAEAQKLGYAEADPSFDIDGVDAAHKLTVLTSLAFNTKADFKAVHVEGIRHVSAIDIAFASEFGYRIKLLAIARRTPRGIEQRVHPCMVPHDTPIAHVDGVFNAVSAVGDYVGRVMFEGRGAGSNPTASAVVADLADIAAGRTAPAFGVPAMKLQPLKAAPMAERVGRYYIRLIVRDQPGVLADVSAVLRDHKISIESLVQRGRAEAENQPVAVVLISHDAREADMERALKRIAKLRSVLKPPALIRIEPL